MHAHTRTYTQRVYQFLGSYHRRMASTASREQLHGTPDVLSAREHMECAMWCYEQCVSVGRQVGSLYGEAAGWYGMAIVQRERGDGEASILSFRLSLRLYNTCVFCFRVVVFVRCCCVMVWLLFLGACQLGFVFVRGLCVCVTQVSKLATGTHK